MIEEAEAPLAIESALEETVGEYEESEMLILDTDADEMSTKDFEKWSLEESAQLPLVEPTATRNIIGTPPPPGVFHTQLPTEIQDSLDIQSLPEESQSETIITGRESDQDVSIREPFSIVTLLSNQSTIRSLEIIIAVLVVIMWMSVWIIRRR